MAADLSGAIAKYLQEMQKDVIWKALVDPVKRKKTGADTDNLAAYQRLLMMTHYKAKALFEPAGRPCVRPDDCEQDEICVNGECRPERGGSNFSGRPCVRPDDCDQNELCIFGQCVPVPFHLEFASRTEEPVYGDDLKAAFSVYYGQIHRILLAGVVKYPSKLADVRDLLMQTYSDALAIAGPRLQSKQCKVGDDCAEDHMCVNGICVPIPFRIVFRPFGS